MRYSTVLFDLDGTIIDTNELIIQTFLYTLESYFPGKFSREDVLPHLGQTLFEQMERFGGKERVDELVAHYREYNIRMHDELVRDFPYVLEVLEELKRIGVTMGVVTTKMQKTAYMGMALYGIDKYMKTTVTYESTPEHKPHPAPVLKAIQELGADPAKTLMVGDSEYDIQAGQSAGVATAGVAWSLKGPDYLSEYKPDYLLQDMLELLPVVRGDGS